MSRRSPGSLTKYEAITDQIESNLPPIVVATICNCLDVYIGIVEAEIAKIANENLKPFFE